MATLDVFVSFEFDQVSGLRGAVLNCSGRGPVGGNRKQGDSMTGASAPAVESMPGRLSRAWVFTFAPHIVV